MSRRRLLAGAVEAMIILGCASWFFLAPPEPMADPLIYATTPSEQEEIQYWETEEAEHMEIAHADDQDPVQNEYEDDQILQFAEEDEKILLRIAMAEAEGEDTEGKALVMLVVLNRVENEEFPDTVKAVVFQKGQFSPVRDNGRYWDANPDEDCYAALAAVRSGWNRSQGALYFENPHGQEDTWHSRNLTKLFSHGNHVFYK